jgi:hypothetical protein
MNIITRADDGIFFDEIDLVDNPVYHADRNAHTVVQIGELHNGEAIKAQRQVRDGNPVGIHLKLKRTGYTITASQGAQSAKSAQLQKTPSAEFVIHE